MRLIRYLLPLLVFFHATTALAAEPEQNSATPAPTMHQAVMTCLFSRNDQIWGMAEMLDRLGFTKTEVQSQLRFVTRTTVPQAEDTNKKQLDRNLQNMLAEGGVYYHEGSASSSEYYYYEGYIRQPVLVDSEGHGEKWTISFMVDAASQLHQGWTVLYPQRLTSKDELDTLVHSIDESFVGEQHPYMGSPEFQGMDVILANMRSFSGEAYDATVSYRSTEVTPGLYQFCILLR